MAMEHYLRCDVHQAEQEMQFLLDQGCCVYSSVRGKRSHGALRAGAMNVHTPMNIDVRISQGFESGLVAPFIYAA